ncbi:hypothetical protein ACGFIE_06120 [Micromonospora sp. NPDC049275]|uniref:hypothetical protein n=1 Tax=Micromonospora sp. NPDC049275 TaxID=3364268 RepID=UPI00371ACC92
MGESATPPAASGSGDHRIRTLAVIGVVANVLGVVTAVESVLRRDVLLFALTLTAVLLLAGFWLWYRRTRLAIALLALGCLVLGGVVATQLGRQSTPPPTAGSSTATPPTSAPAPAPTTTAAAAPLGSTPTQATTAPGGTTATDPDAPRTLVDRSVVLPRFAAVDVDRPEQQVVAKHSGGATDGLDLYHDWGQVRADNVRVANGPNVYPYSGGNPAQAYAGCVASAAGSALPSFTDGADFCFRTSEGRLGFATITDTRADQAFVVHVVVWDATGA